MLQGPWPLLGTHTLANQHPWLLFQVAPDSSPVKHSALALKASIFCLKCLLPKLKINS